MFFFYFSPSIFERNWIFSSWMVTQRWKRRSHIFSDRILSSFLSFYFLTLTHRKIRRKQSRSNKAIFLVFSCLLVLYFSTPRCLLGFFKFSVGAPIHFCVCVPEKLFLFLFCFASSFSFNTKTREQHIFWLIPETEGQQARTLDVVWCVCLCCCCCFSSSFYRSIAPPQKTHTAREMTQGRSCLLGFLHFTWVLVMMMAISCTCHREKTTTSSRSTFSFFKTNAHLSLDWHLVVVWQWF